MVNNRRLFTFREDDSCENHTVVAEYIGHLVFDKQGVYPVFQDDCRQQIFLWIQLLGNFNDFSCSHHQILERSRIKRRNSFCLTHSGNTIGSQKKGNGEYTGSSNFWTLTTRFRPIPRFWIYSPDLGKRGL